MVWDRQFVLLLTIIRPPLLEDAELTMPLRVLAVGWSSRLLTGWRSRIM